MSLDADLAKSATDTRTTRKSATSKDIAKTVADRNSVIAEIETLSAELTAATAGNAALNNQLVELADQAGQAKSQTAKAEQAKEAADACANELATELAAVRSDLSAERAKRDEAQQARRTVEVNLANAAADLARASQQMMDLTACRDAAAAGEHAATRAAHAAEVERLTTAHKETGTRAKTALPGSPGPSLEGKSAA